MLGAYSVPKPNPIATWNPDRDLWETMDAPIFGPSDVYSETWPTAGMTRNGVVYELPTWAPRTAGRLLRVLGGLQTHDPTNSYKLYSAEVLRTFPLRRRARRTPRC